MNRRDYLKASAILVSGSAVTACDDSSDGAANQAIDSAISDSDLFEQGAIGIDHSGWTKTKGLQAQYPALDGDIEADVAVVGAGLAGSSLALHLTKAGCNVVVLEARQPGWGASGRNAGHVLPTLRDVDIIRGFADGGEGFLQAFQQHHTIPFDLAKTYNIECDASQDGYLTGTSSQKYFDQLVQQSTFWSEQQGQPVEFLNAEDMKAATGSSYYTQGVKYNDGGRVNPYLLTNGLISAAIQQYGLKVFGDSEVVALNKAGKAWRVATSQGSVRASRVVFCTNAYPNQTVAEFSNSFYPLTAYGLSTKPLTAEQQKIIMPSKATFAQYPLDLNPFVVDGAGRIITSLIPAANSAQDAAGYFKQHLAWIHRIWPESKHFTIELESYWTGRVALRDKEFPGVFEVEPGVFGLMHFNAWGNVMAPLMGKLLARGLMADRLDTLPFPMESPTAVGNPHKQHLIIRRLMIPAARLGQKLGIL